MTAKLWITRGLPASGKTVWAREQVDAAPAGTLVRLNRDDLRASMLATGYAEPLYPCEELITAVQHSGVEQMLRKGVSVIVDDTNLRSRTARTLAGIAEKVGADWECVDHFLDVSVDDCVLRDRCRSGSVGEHVILRMYQKYLSGGRTLPVPVIENAPAGKPYVPLPGSIEAVICDIDGTVALHDGVRDPYDTSKYHEDLPNEPVIQLVNWEILRGNRVLFCSGRDEAFRDVTEAWIEKHVIRALWRSRWELFMRPAGDKRNDAVVKLELFDKYIRDEYDVLRVYDDRDRVVAAWRSIGLTVLQVADGNF